MNSEPGSEQGSSETQPLPGKHGKPINWNSIVNIRWNPALIEEVKTYLKSGRTAFPERFRDKPGKYKSNFKRIFAPFTVLGGKIQLTIEEASALPPYFLDEAGKLLFSVNLPMTFHVVETEEEKKEIITQYYSNVLANAYRSGTNLHQRLMKEYINIGRRDVFECLQNIEIKQITYPIEDNKVVQPIITSHPMQHWQIDLVYMNEYKKQNSGYTYLMNVMDVFSKFIWSIPLKNRLGLTIVEQLEKILCNEGVPDVIQTDNGVEFVNEHFQELQGKYNFEHRRSLPYKSSTNGGIEKANSTLKNYVFRHVTNNENKRYVDDLGFMVYSYNSTTHTTTKHTPFEVHRRRHECFKVRVLKDDDAEDDIDTEQSQHTDKNPMDSWEFELIDTVNELQAPAGATNFKTTHLLMLVDTVSAFAWCVPLKNNKGSTVASNLQKIICNEGSPKRLRSQSTFDSVEIRELCRRFGIVAHIAPKEKEKETGAVLIQVRKHILAQINSDNRQKYVVQLQGMLYEYNANPSFDQITNNSPMISHRHGVGESNLNKFVHSNISNNATKMIENSISRLRAMKDPLHKGDVVRIGLYFLKEGMQMLKNCIRKKDLLHWSKTLYSVADIEISKDGISLYKLIIPAGEQYRDVNYNEPDLDKRKFYRHQLMKVAEYDKIDKIDTEINKQKDYTFREQYVSNLYTEESKCAILNEQNQEKALKALEALGYATDENGRRTSTRERKLTYKAEALLQNKTKKKQK
jgi:hypothetical protein